MDGKKLLKYFNDFNKDALYKLDKSNPDNLTQGRDIVVKIDQLFPPHEIAGVPFKAKQDFLKILQEYNYEIVDDSIKYHYLVDIYKLLLQDEFKKQLSKGTNEVITARLSLTFYQIEEKKKVNHWAKYIAVIGVAIAIFFVFKSCSG